MPVALAAALAAAAFLVLAAFQLGLAAGAPWGEAAWGGRIPGRLPAKLRFGSAVSVGLYLFAALIVLDRAGLPVVDLPDGLSRPGAWALVAMLAVGAVMNAVSPSRYERFGWAPFAAATALCVLVVALGPAA